MLDIKALTQRQREVLRLLVKGHCIKTMSTVLGISEPSIEKHLSKLYRKLGVYRREQAIAKVMASEEISREINQTLGFTA